MRRNCPKYINIRKLIAHPHTFPKVEHRHRQWGPQGRLPEEVVAFILQADTVFVGSIYKSSPSDLHTFPPHAGMNARSGLPGFIRVSPSDGRTVVVPDYSGNRFMSTLGNIEESGMVGLTIVSFTTGDILYLTGTARNLVGQPALEVMTRHAALTSVNVTGFIFVRDALPVRQQDDTPVERSPYSPKVKYLVEETGAQSRDSAEHKAKLQEAPGAGDLRIRPGQAIVLDFMEWIGPPEYQHTADSNPQSINDDRVRTWTVSSAHEEKNVTCFELTMRAMKGGAVTGALFDQLRKGQPDQKRQRIVFDTPVVADIVGITGDFCMDREKLDVLWVAGGIGITPFLAMLNALAECESAAEGDVMLVLSTREPNIMLYMMRHSLERIASTVRISIAIFTHDSEFDAGPLKPNQSISVHRGRIFPEFWKDIPRSKDVFICGPNASGDSVTDGLLAVAVSPSQIHREGFY
ncbi:Oxidoreductase [Aspergillus sclerotialis]|uniref:Oxidoreductase n=1 Tax=Aspergillus sclerotialis TaxID=2070753 RepID=A0A3A2ZRQ2_9EURO|nr:Oxidoreductase [Aspergillus sclerotialis]